MIYVTGDTHIPIDVHKLSSKRFPAQGEMTKDDYVIVCGDFGAVWHDNGEQRYWLKWLDDKPFTTLFVDGNHENHDLLNAYPVESWNGGRTHKVSGSVYHLMRGQPYTARTILRRMLHGAYRETRARPTSAQTVY